MAQDLKDERIADLQSQMDGRKIACETAVRALKAAHHELVTHHGLLATDKDREEVKPEHLFVLSSKNEIGLIAMALDQFRSAGIDVDSSLEPVL